MIEEWKDIQGVRAGYEVSNLGRIRSAVTKQLRKLMLDDDGYQQFTIWNYGAYKTLKVHRCVALAFIPNPQKLPEINHKDGDKRNNAARNLEWVTTQENIRHAFATGLHKPKAGRSVQQIRNGAVVAEHKSLADAARAVGCDVSNLCAATKHRKGRKTCAGYEWRYITKEDI